MRMAKAFLRILSPEKYGTGGTATGVGPMNRRDTSTLIKLSSSTTQDLVSTENLDRLKQPPPASDIYHDMLQHQLPTGIMSYTRDILLPSHLEVMDRFR